MQFCCLHNYRYYELLRLLFCRNNNFTVSLYAFHSTATAVQRKVSPVPNHTINTCRFPYTGGFFNGALQVLPIFHGLHPFSQGSTSSLSTFVVLSNDTAEFTLCYNLYSCSHPFGLLYLHASNPVFLLRLVVGYKASWQLP